MVKTYLKTGWRNLKRNKTYAFINVLGLSLSMACGILIFSLVAYHFSFDRFHAHQDRIYRIVSEFHSETIEHQPGAPQPLGKAFKNDFSFAEKTGRVFSINAPIISLPGEP